ncbi:tetratricopeptide repeat protein [Azospirillum rugosum]|uniref:Tetratricopeptide (TPR) repeat protein n=1 Tax=Azospirillum rugosum TaxID=416170 RepID=A0ABS4SP20_9PROT|nr:tetratricopeptide repeat protein [Azospirillum rugosum]MBP2294303.1 tetratricopeptide (TPR) repeat protein [Azospirillum rugosum]MDQ0527638.1 tetratricopeptide (TPR) repeat protein [Azospirillum rugosum]
MPVDQPSVTDSVSSVPDDPAGFVEAYRRFAMAFAETVHQETGDVLGALNGQYFLNRIIVFNRFFRRTAAHFLLAQGVDYHRMAILQTASRDFGRMVGLDPRALAIEPFFDLQGPAETPAARAEAYYRSALNLAPGLGQAHFNLARLLDARGDGAAADHYEQAAKFNARFHPHAHLRLAFIREAAGQTGAALDHYRAALAEGTHFGELHARVARFLWAHGTVEEALEQFDRAAEPVHYYAPEFIVDTPSQTDLDVAGAFRSMFAPAASAS